ncbi:MAG TPA: neuraminidase-like domain-containing protein [Solirubrobacteraceae bacterium]|nr:neuraminidase-like domain-containing protein [Solirubrobacteraceae bacterium]
MSSLEEVAALRVPRAGAKREAAGIHRALGTVGLDVSREEARARRIGPSTEAALRELQRRASLPETGELDEPTLERLKAEVQHRVLTHGRYRARRLQDLLAQAGLPVDPAEARSREFRESSLGRMRELAEAEGMPHGELVTERLVGAVRERALAGRLSSRTQIAKLQRAILRAGRIRKLDLAIDGAEMSARTIGPSTREAIRAFQEHAGLPATGEVDTATFERLTTVASSRPGPVPVVSAPDPAALERVPRVLRLNATNKDVPRLQRALAFLGHDVAGGELHAARFGRSTRQAVIAFQAASELPQTGHADAPTLAKINAAIAEAAPSVAPGAVNRIRGSVRDERWAGRGGVTVELRTRPLRGEGDVLATRTTLGNGFFDLPYAVPTDPVTGRPVTPLNLTVVFSDAGGEIGRKQLFNPTAIAWANFTEGDQPYRGTSEYETRLAAIVAAAEGVPIGELAETAASPEISRVAQAAGLAQDDVMAVVLAHRAAGQLADPQLDAPVVFGFVAQSLPPSLPDELLAAASEWELIDQLVDRVASGIAFMDADLQRRALETALGDNLLPVTVGLRQDAILAALAAKRQAYALDKPILVGDGSLRALLDATAVPEARYVAVADAFIAGRGLGDAFWSDVRARPDDFGGAAAVADLETTVQVGLVAKNHLPTVTFLKARIGDAGDERLNGSRDTAKLTPATWAELIRENGDAVPEGTDGATPEERRETYARTLAAQSERIFPTVAFTAEMGRSGEHLLSHVPDVAQIVDDHPQLDLRVDNVDAFARTAALHLDPEVRAELRVMQRAHRLAPSAAAGRALLDQRLHSSSQIVGLGKAEVVSRLGASGVDRRTALTIHGYAELQYAQVLARLADYRAELHRNNPSAVLDHTVTQADRELLLAEIPDLEVLFGPLDACDCEHCQSVYSPAAYLADLLRWLDAHPAEIGGRSVRAVLAERRPDVGSLKLNCENTETALPYIDIVCEILEAAVPGSSGVLDLQTTRPQAELRAAPEREDRAAYDVLRTASAPMSSCFDLWQDQARVFLDHLGVPRWRLMQAFRDPATGTPSALSEAGEYFGLSSHETGLVVTAAATAAAQQGFWFFDATLDEQPVLDVLGHAHVEYAQLLTLLTVRWITPDGAPQRVALARPPESCALDQQSIVHLSPAALDRMHRFLRLWRHVPWDMWQLDLLLRAPRLGGGRLDAAALVALRDAALVRSRLEVPTETLAAWFGSLPTEGRPDPEHPGRAAMSMFASLFQNPAVVTPPDPAFALPLAGGDLQDHRPTLLAALTVTDEELSALFARVGTTLDLAHVGALVRWTTLARALRLTVPELLAVAELVVPAVPDPFASPAALLRFLDVRETIARSGLAVAELAFLLQARPDSPYALPDAVVTDFARTLRESLRTNPAAGRAGQAAAHVASAFSLSATHAALMLARLEPGGALARHLTDPALDARDASGAYVNALEPASFPELYRAYRLLHKVARLVRAHGLDDDRLAWLIDHAAALGALELGRLPVDAPPAAPLFGAWLTLATWLDVRRALATPEELVLIGADAGATVAQARAAAAELTGIPEPDLARLDGGSRAAYATVDLLSRLVTCAAQARRLGVSPATCRSWADRDRSAAPDQAEVAAQVRRTAKSKYDDAVWLSTVTPLQDALRERKRDGLVAFLIEHSLRTESPTVDVGGVTYANRRHWRTPDDLLRYFLLDVEMSPCQPTSRVKQAIGSTQMFVQRCFLNLEKPDVVVSGAERADEVALDSWRQWRWMKSYRLWEANRKVFLYPENWIEPELRDDKSPFFVELENELMQGDITAASCETALRHYVEKVHEVANLQVVGVYHEVDDDSPYDSLPPATNLLHVVGRTRVEPAAYHYRRFDLNEGSWSAWERIDLDITGEHVVPVVYNRVLHLFWLRIEEKAQKTTRQPAAQATSQTQEAPQPPKQLEIKLAWSVRQGSGWSARRTSPHTLVHPWQRPVSAYNLKPRYKSRENHLWLDLYVSTTLSFNNRRFYDPYRGISDFVTAHRFDETARPWHSSSFVFDGNVVAVKLKPLRGQYHVLDAQGVASPGLSMTTSYDYVRDAGGEAGRALEPLTGGYEIAPRLALPDGMHFEGTRLVNNTWKANTNSLTVLESGRSVPLLTAARAPFELTFSQHHVQMDTAGYERSPFFYSDTGRSYFIRSDWLTVAAGSSQTVQRLQYTFYPFTHPYTALFLRELNRSGAEGLLNRKIQRFPETFHPGNSFSFVAYGPSAGSAVADASARADVVDFSRHGAHAIYNWEIFFHVPFLIACRLMQNQRFEEALTWFHFVFDPTDNEALDAPQRFWVTKPFFDQSSDTYRRERIESILATIGDHLDEVRSWKNDPFKPHLVARMRPVAYQKAVVMKYVDNLVAWADQLFRRDTMESINEATLLYALAGELLGRRPERVPPVSRAARSYDELTTHNALDPFGNQRADVLLENFTDRPTAVVGSGDGAPPLPQLPVQYFAIPGNDDLLSYWSTVEQQLFKIRNCRNIEGAERVLPLFEPPLDPAALVRAAAEGVDLDSVLSEAGAAGSPYRFRVLLARALEVAAEVRGLGERMLGVLERRDAEALALLQSEHEAALQRTVTRVRREQVSEAEKTVEGLQRGLAGIATRADYYGGLPRMNAWEIAGTTGHGLGIVSEIVATVLNTVGGAASLVPQLTIGAAGFGGSPVAVVTFGGQNVATSSTNFAALFGGLSTILHSGAQMLEAQGQYTRQDDSNKFQKALADDDRAQLEAQIEAAQAGAAVAAHELGSHELRVEQLDATTEYLRSKYTSGQLYEWMVTQMSTVYFQSYQLAYDLAKRAERAFRFELGHDGGGPSFVQFGYWDSLKKGLLSGDRLANDLRRMEAAFLEADTRTLELTKSVSLATVAPMQLLELKSSGACTVRLPEWLFDLDHPGHYQRRIRSVELSVPSVVGPYTNVNATVSLTRNGIRLVDDMTGGYGDPLVAGDTRFASVAVPMTSIATSRAIGDRGMFELQFDNDRYLPFEGAGVVSEWRITLDPASNQFDLGTVSDVVLRLEYTALPGGPALVTGARTALDAVLPTAGARMLVLDSELSGEWYRFLHPGEGADQTLTIPFTADQLPFASRRLARTKTLNVTRADLIVESPHAGAFDFRLARPGTALPAPAALPKDPAFGGLHHQRVAFPPGAALLGDWQLQLKRDADGDFRSLTADLVPRAYLLVQFQAA